MKEYTINELSQQVDNLVQKLGGYWSPLAMLAAVIEEIGELAREINAIEKNKPKKNISHNSNNEIIKKIGEEVSDSIFSLICLGNYFKIDIGLYLNQILEKYEKRDLTRFT